MCNVVESGGRDVGLKGVGGCHCDGVLTWRMRGSGVIVGGEIKRL